MAAQLRVQSNAENTTTSQETHTTTTEARNDQMHSKQDIKYGPESFWMVYRDNSEIMQTNAPVLAV